MKFTDPKYYFPQFFLNEQDYMIQQMVHEFVEKEIMPVRHLLDDDTDRRLTKEIRRKLADIGIQRMPFPKEYGGDGLTSAVTKSIVGEELARGDLGIAMGNTCTDWAWTPALFANHRPVLDEFMPAFCGDELKIACYSMTEPGGAHGGGGFDIENPALEARKLRTIAKLEGDQWVINGSKMWASNGGEADLYCVVCTVDPDLGYDGIVLIYHPFPWEGFSLGHEENKTGMRTDSNCAMYYDNVRVPKKWGIGPGGIATKAFHRNFLGARHGAMATGVIRGAFETVLDYTGDRIVGNKPIRQHSLAAKVLGEMAIALETSRIFYLTSAYMADHPEVYGPVDEGFMPARMNIAKSYAPGIAVELIGEAMKLMGSYAYVRENHIEKYWRDAKEFHLMLGSVYLNTFNVCRGYYDLEI